MKHFQKNQKKPNLKSTVLLISSVFLSKMKQHGLKTEGINHFKIPENVGFKCFKSRLYIFDFYTTAKTKMSDSSHLFILTELLPQSAFQKFAMFHDKFVLLVRKHQEKNIVDLHIMGSQSKGNLTKSNIPETNENYFLLFLLVNQWASVVCRCSYGN